ncbi:WecB/TagA/CpsF family glycosyltransferase [Siphonobacter sp.]|uniref:WecB/TagA/CpsF family glycosyltransferase n=1 Tax=Siphonobacter sp. TaxID=1869184 RepID=UPI003B3A8E9A
MKKKLISIDLTTGHYASFIDRQIAMAQQRTSAYTCVSNVHMLVEAYRDASFAEVVNQADMATPDGRPLTWGLKLIHGYDQERVAGLDLMPDLIAEAEKKGISVYFYGGTPQMLEATDRYLKKTHPKLQVAGYYSPPFRPLTSTEEDETAAMINRSGAQLVFVALGCPKQERWMAAMKGKIQAAMIGIGGALPMMVGLQSKAPNWMRASGLEWVYRFMLEPRRLFKRYAITNSTYIWLVTRAMLQPKAS